MSETNRIPQKLIPWVDARRRLKLSGARVQMAREMGLNPGKLGKLANYEQQPWKVPLLAYIERLYEKRFGRSRPERVRSIEELVRHRREKKAPDRSGARVGWLESARERIDVADDRFE